jgi:hypothetical protein
MSGLHLTGFRFNVLPLVAELQAHPELWNDFDLRTNHPQSPHRELDDIFVRYNARENFDGDRDAFNGPHDAVWWPATDVLPSAQQIALDLMSQVQGERLGMVLITRIPPGAKCYPHVDKGWHARHFDKYAVQLASAPAQSFHVEDESLIAGPGECYWFDNSRPHWVVNDSDQARMTMIVCIRNRFTGEGACQ